MAYTFMNALGYSIGTSICETDKIELAKDMMAKAKEKDVKFLIPVDNIVANKYEAGRRRTNWLTPTKFQTAGWVLTSGLRPKLYLLTQSRARHSCVERPDGRFRMGNTLQRHNSSCKGSCRKRLNFHHRRRRFCCCS